ncbi:MAG: hypothetical protein BWY17_00888 [Deltaproteobacteria bacterium ADurb.Bin207]|nr:MAG: hypothetical protein BWY17_00888 [Deltaproteobacteria bacterium ADurb.Bin207]HPY17756.1 hypothetical protein [Polyangiaceae bacterium]
MKSRVDPGTEQAVKGLVRGIVMSDILGQKGVPQHGGTGNEACRRPWEGYRVVGPRRNVMLRARDGVAVARVGVANGRKTIIHT